MLDTSARLLRLLSILQTRPVWTATDLSERLEVTPRTIRRDVARLRALGYPVDGEVGVHGGYRLARGAELPPLLFSDQEAVAVAVGLRLAADGSVGGLDESTVSALAKLDQVLPEPLARQVRAVHESVDELQGRDPDRVVGAVFLALAQACRDQVRLRIGYTDSAGRSSERRIDPYRLVRSGPRWYLVARDIERDAWRTLRVDRIDQVEATRQPTDITDPPDPVALVAHAQGVGPYAMTARFRLPLPMHRARQLVPRTVGSHTADGPDATIIEAGGPDAEKMARWLAGMGPTVEVLGPPELRAAMAEHAAALLAANSGSNPGA